MNAAPSGTLAPTRVLSVNNQTVRLISLDVFRGMTMLFMASEIMRIAEVAGRAYPDNSFARVLANMLEHREWVGCAPWDLIQPAFMFMVGVSLPYSVASRMAKGESFTAMFGHCVYRSLVLILLGIFLRSQGRPQTYFTFEDVLTQIGLGYTFLFLLALTTPKIQWSAAAIILIGYWAAFALYPLPPPGFDSATVGVASDWPHRLTGFAAHWDKNSNLASHVDQWFLNLFPRETPFVYNRGGYLTLNFIPSLATMIFGLRAGQLLRGGRGAPEKLRRLIAFGLAGLVAGAALHILGICPLVKRIWTPSWTVYSAGWSALLLAGFYYVIDMRGNRRWAFPFLVVGVNSITMYVLVHVAAEYIITSLLIHFGRKPFEIFGPDLVPVTTGAAALLSLWVMLYWMYRRKIFLRI